MFNATMCLNIIRFVKWQDGGVNFLFPPEHKTSFITKQTRLALYTYKKDGKRKKKQQKEKLDHHLEENKIL